MNIWTSENYQDGLYLIAGGEPSFIGITNMEFISENDSLKDYRNWHRSYLKNVISVSDEKYSPQYYQISSIRVLHSLSDLMEDEFGKTGLKTEDVSIPIIGGVTCLNFRKLLNALWALESDKPYEYIELIRKYYKESFEEVERGKS